MTAADTNPAQTGPRIVCACCQNKEVPALEPVCPDCRTSLESAGILKPKSELVQIGPLDV